MNSVIAILLGVALSCGQVPAEPREVTVSVRVITHDGKPVAGVGVRAKDLANPPCDVTNAEGSATLKVRIENPAVSSIRIDLGVCDGPDGDAVLGAIYAFKDNFGTQDAYCVELPREKSAVSLSIVGLETVKLRANTTLNQTGLGPELLVSRLDNARPAKTRRGTGWLELSGVPRNRDSEIVLQSYKGLMEVRQVTAAQAASDIDWGEIALKVSNASIPVSISVNLPQELPADLGYHCGTYFLIKSDRSVAFEGVARENQHLRGRMSMPPHEKPKLPPGDYYIAAGEFWSSWINEQLWSTLKKPNAEQILRDARWPKITVPEKGECTAEVALDDIIAAARKVRGF